MAKIFTIEEVLETNELILVDSSLNKGKLCRRLHGAINYNLLDIDMLRRCCESTRLFLEILNHPNTMTIPEVTKELKEYHKVTKKKIEWMEKIKQYKTLICPKRKEILHDISKLILEGYRLSKKIEYYPNDKNYEQLIEMVRTLEKYFQIKKKKPNNNGEQRKSSLTDEKMIATAYWIAMHSDIRPALLTGDMDFCRLLGISSEWFRKVNANFAEMLEERSPKLYLAFGEYLDSVSVKEITLCHARRGPRKWTDHEQKTGLYKNLEEISAGFIPN